MNRSSSLRQFEQTQILTKIFSSDYRFNALRIEKRAYAPHVFSRVVLIESALQDPSSSKQNHEVVKLGRRKCNGQAVEIFVAVVGGDGDIKEMS